VDVLREIAAERVQRGDETSLQERAGMKIVRDAVDVRSDRLDATANATQPLFAF
jgi:hypothetical protein